MRTILLALCLALCLALPLAAATPSKADRAKKEAAAAAEAAKTRPAPQPTETDHPKTPPQIFAKVSRIIGPNLVVRCFTPPVVYISDDPKNHPSIWVGTVYLTGHPDAASMADDDTVRCLVSPTGKTRKIGSATLREYQFVRAVK